MTVASELGADLQPRYPPFAEFARLTKGTGLLPQFAAVLAGLRPGMDCWVPVEHMESFRSFAAGLGLSLRADCAFRPLPVDGRDRFIGHETLCTTFAIGIPIVDAKAGDTVHMFVAGSDADATRLCSSGWYSVIVNDRVFHKPRIDHLAFGAALGYPPCCISFFAKSNNWNTTNSYVEAYRNTRGSPDYRTNCFGKNIGFSLNFHLPCRFDCPATITASDQLLAYLTEHDPTYVSACYRLLRMPVFSLNEREVVLLDGAPDGENRLRYTGLRSLFATPDAVLGVLRRGNTIEVRGRFAAVFRDAEFVDVIEARCDEFGPRVPLLLTWTSDEP